MALHLHSQDILRRILHWGTAATAEQRCVSYRSHLRFIAIVIEMAAKKHLSSRSRYFCLRFFITRVTMGTSGSAGMQGEAL